jgi:hypothetical protein
VQQPLQGKYQLRKYTMSVDIDLDYVEKFGGKQEDPNAAYPQISPDK